MSIGTAQQIIELKNPTLIGDPRVSDYISLAKLNLASRAFGAKYEYAVALLVLHQIAIESQSSSGANAIGPVSSKKEGQLAVTFGGVSSNTPWTKQYLMSTAYGQELQFLYNSTIFTPRNRFSNV